MHLFVRSSLLGVVVASVAAAGLVATGGTAEATLLSSKSKVRSSAKGTSRDLSKVRFPDVLMLAADGSDLTEGAPVHSPLGRAALVDRGFFAVTGLQAVHTVRAQMVTGAEGVLVVPGGRGAPARVFVLTYVGGHLIVTDLTGRRTFFADEAGSWPGAEGLGVRQVYFKLTTSARDVREDPTGDIALRAVGFFVVHQPVGYRRWFGPEGTRRGAELEHHPKGEAGRLERESLDGSSSTWSEAFTLPGSGTAAPRFDTAAPPRGGLRPSPLPPTGAWNPATYTGDAKINSLAWRWRLTKQGFRRRDHLAALREVFDSPNGTQGTLIAKERWVDQAAVFFFRKRGDMVEVEGGFGDPRRQMTGRRTSEPSGVTWDDADDIEPGMSYFKIEYPGRAGRS